MIENNQLSGDYWADKLSPDSSAFNQANYWLANPIVDKYYSQRITSGQSSHWLDYACEKYIEVYKGLPLRVLSVGCGAGWLEQKLHRLHLFTEIDAFDYSPRLIASAKEEAQKCGVDNVKYFVGDGNSIELPQDHYDVVIFNMSLHHIENLEHLLSQVSSSLKSGGYIFIHEYVGPDRFDFTPRQKGIMDAMLALIPERYLMSRSGLLKRGSPYPDPHMVKLDDPTESVRSSEILKLVNERFSVLETNRAGGTTLQFLLNDIAGNFHEGDEASVKVLKMLINIEETMLDIHELNSDFVFVVAQSRHERFEDI